MKWVIVQAVLLAILIVVPFESMFDVDERLVTLSQVIGLAGFAIGLTAVFNLRKSLSIAPKPKENGQLQVHGIYAHIRHPMYVAVWMIMGGPAIASGNYYKIGIFIVLVVFFIFKTKHEERLLLKSYPGYESYMKKVGAYVPRVVRR